MKFSSFVCLFLLSVSVFIAVSAKKKNKCIKEETREYTINEPTCGDRPTSGGKEESVNEKIVGGTVTSLYMWPWFVLITLTNADNKPEQYCGGSLINRRFVLTAAHCFINPVPTKVEVSVVDTSTNQTDKIEIPSSQRYSHPRFFNYNWDYALLDLGADRTSYTPVCLYVLNRGFDDNGRNPGLGLVMGYGTTTQQNASIPGSRAPPSSDLRLVQLQFVAKDTCERYLRKNLESEQFCMGGEENKDTCQGDSGGPVIVGNSQDRKFYQFGIISAGTGCGLKDKPGIYNRICCEGSSDPLKVIAWIKSKMNGGTSG